jgi:hypothetical protein
VIRGLQFLGAYAYDVTGWNGRYVYDVILPGDQPKRTFDDADLAVSFARERGGRIQSLELSVDTPAYRHCLWSLRDNPISHYVMNFSRARARREKARIEFLRNDG